MSSVSRDLLRAVLEVRDHRHNETHAALVALFQALASELIQSGAVRADNLAGRLDRIAEDVAPDPHGEAAHALVGHLSEWLRDLRPPSALPHPVPWRAPVVSGPTEAG